MEGRLCIAIFFVVVGIVQVFSYPQPDDDVTRLSPDETSDDSFLQFVALGDEGQDIRRTKREQPVSPTKPTRKDKTERLSDLARAAVHADRRAAYVRQRVLQNEALFNQTENILERYEAQGATRAQAIERLHREHPELAAPFRTQRP